MGIQSAVNSALGSVAVTKAYLKHKKESRDAAAQKAANAKAQQAVQAKATQQRTRRNFMRDYLSKQPTSLGGTVGDLPYDMQKQIAGTYDRNARRRMMNQMDREARR